MDLFGDKTAASKYKDEVREIFNSVDLDGSGIVEKEEFIQAVKYNKRVSNLVSKSRILSGLLATGEFEQAFSSFDSDGGGTVTFEEFWAFCSQEADEEHIRAMFNLIDTDGSRFITHAEMVHAFTENQMVLNLARESKVFSVLVKENNWDQVMAEMDTDKSGGGDNKIDYIEFWKFCQGIGARARVQVLKDKARDRAEKVEEKKKVLNDDLQKRLCLHVFKSGVSHGGVFSVSIASDFMNYPFLEKSSNPYASSKQDKVKPVVELRNKRDSASVRALSNKLRGMTFVRVGEN